MGAPSFPEGNAQVIAVDELLPKHGIALADTKPGRYYTTCPKCSKDRRSPDTSRQVSRRHHRARRRGQVGLQSLRWTGPEKGSGERQDHRHELHLPRRRRRAALPQGAQRAGTRAAVLARTTRWTAWLEEGHEGRRHHADLSRSMR